MECTFYLLIQTMKVSLDLTSNHRGKQIYRSQSFLKKILLTLFIFLKGFVRLTLYHMFQ